MFSNRDLIKRQLRLGFGHYWQSVIRMNRLV